MSMSFEKFIKTLEKNKSLLLTQEQESKNKMQVLDTVALGAAIVNDSPNNSNLVLARLVLTMGGRKLQYKDKDKGFQVWEEQACLASAFCHGGRIMIEHHQQGLYNNIVAGSDASSRAFSTHALRYDANASQQKFTEEKTDEKGQQLNGKKVSAKQTAVNVAMYGEGSQHPMSKKTVRSNGCHGHLFMMHRDNGETTPGALCCGLEGSEFSKVDPSGQRHLFGRSSPKCISGSGLKFPVAANNTLLKNSSIEGKFNTFRVDRKAGDPIKFSDNPEELKRQAVAKLFGKDNLTENQYDCFLTALRKHHCNEPPKQTSILTRASRWVADNPLKVAAAVGLGAVVGAGLGVAFIIGTGGLGAAVITALGLAGALTVGAVVGGVALGGLAVAERAVTNAANNPTKAQLQNYSAHYDVSYQTVVDAEQEQAGLQADSAAPQESDRQCSVNRLDEDYEPDVGLFAHPRNACRTDVQPLLPSCGISPCVGAI